MVKVLIVKPSSLGDILHTAPAVELLATRRPECRLTWLVNEEYSEFVKDLPGVSEVISFPRGRFRLRRFPLWVPEALSWSRALRQGFDLAMDFQGLQRSGLMSQASGAKERFGFRDARELAWLHYSHPVEVPRAVIHAVDRNLYLVRKALADSRLLRKAHGDLAPSAVEDEDIEAGFASNWCLKVPPAALAFAEKALAGGFSGSSSVDSQGAASPPIALCPGARWESKRWPTGRWAELSDALHHESVPFRPILLGGAGDAALLDLILAQASAPIESFVGKTTVWQTAALLKKCAAAVGVDSAPLHLAQSLGVPSVSLFGPTDPSRVGPRGQLHRVLQRENLECNGCYHRACPLPRRLCLPEIPAQTVVAALKDFCLKGR